jgi:hypothetical protein
MSSLDPFAGNKIGQRLLGLLAPRLLALGHVDVRQPNPDLLTLDQERDRVTIGDLHDLAGN